MRTIMLDLFFLHDQYFRRGIGRYGIEIAKRIIKLDRNQYRIVAIGFGSESESIERLGIDPNKYHFDKFISAGPPEDSKPRFNLNLYKKFVAPTVKSINPDVYIATHFDRGLPTDLTNVTVPIHDVIPLVTGSYSKKGFIANILKGMYYRSQFAKVYKAKAVFTSSDYSYSDLIKYGKVPENIIHKIYLGISDVFRVDNIDPDTDRLSVKFFGSKQIPMYIMYDGGFEQNKNTDRLAELFSQIKQSIPELKLVVTGADFFINSEFRSGNQSSYTAINERSQHFAKVLTELGAIDGLVPVGRISERDIAELTKLAQVYMNLSKYEGFGFGPLQAMAAGTPVIAANATTFKELLKDHALLINPDNWDDQISQIVDVFRNEEVRSKMIKSGLEYSKQFNWDNTFDQTWKVIQQVI